MGMTKKEETLDWLYRLRSEIYVYMPKEWLMPMNNALDVAIDTVKREEMLEDWTKKCRKFEADYENRLKADMVAMLTDIQLEIAELSPHRENLNGFDRWGHEWTYGYKEYPPTAKDASEIIQEKIKSFEVNNE